MADVAIVTPRYPPTFVGGGEQSVRLLANHLTSSDRIDGVKVHSFDGEGRTLLDGVEVLRLGKVSPFLTEYQNFSAYRLLRGAVSESDIVHAYNMELNPAVGYLCSKEDIPSIATLNSYHFISKSVTNRTPSTLDRIYETIGGPTTGRILWHFMKRIDAFTALSDSVRTIYSDHGLDDKRIEVIPNMIDPSFDPPEIETTRGYQILYVGSLMPSKGVPVLIQALSLLPDDYRVRIVGGGAEEARLRSLVADIGETGRVEFTGWVPHEEIGKIYASADLFVHPALLPEPFGRTILEAMQSGLPVVCTDIGGPPEVVPDAELVCPPGDAERLADTIRRARALGDRVGERYRDYAIGNYSPSDVIPRYVDLYEEVMG